MTFLKCFGVLAVVLILQSTMVHWSFLGNYHPDFIIIFLVFFSLRHGPVVGVFLGFSIGLVQDIYSVETLGANALTKCLVGYGIGLFDESRFTFSNSTRLVILAIAFFLHDVVNGIASGLETNALIMSLFKQSLPDGLLTMVIGFVLFYGIFVKRGA
ncbi:MAG: rod shape-determining protein MreD [Fibrobacteria bacterium]|nr:rod shape-determining protein MreD [Fibrobacteria bacterium]